jgi:hypothetical protein
MKECRKLVEADRPCARNERLNGELHSTDKREKGLLSVLCVRQQNVEQRICTSGGDMLYIMC